MFLTRQLGLSMSPLGISFVYKDIQSHSIAILVINQAIKIDSMTNILPCQTQYCKHYTLVNNVQSFFLLIQWYECLALCLHDPEDHSLPLTMPLSLESVTITVKKEPLVLPNKNNQFLSTITSLKVQCRTIEPSSSPWRSRAWPIMSEG